MDQLAMFEVVTACHSRMLGSRFAVNDFPEFVVTGLQAFLMGTNASFVNSAVLVSVPCHH